MDNEYDVTQYTDEQLFRILDLNNPSDRELEAKILTMVRKYSNFGNSAGDKLTQFFVDIYNHFFENGEPDPDNDEDDDPEKEGFQTASPNKPTLPSDLKSVNIFSSSELSQGTPTTANLGNKVEESKDTQKDNKKDNLKLTKTLDYSKDNLNPLLKQTIKRIISIDSQYRDNRTTTPSTNFTFNLSEPLRDVVSLSLYSIQIPYTWYTVNSDFGGNFFYLKANSPGINNGSHNYKISIPSGNYSPSGLVTAVNTGLQEIAAIYTDVSFGNTAAEYNNGLSSDSGTGKCKFFIDIKRIYNTQNFDLSFSEWSSPIDPSGRLNTLAGYFGFINTQYYCSSIYSYLFPTVINDDVNPISTEINYFYVIPYVGESFIGCDASYTPIKVTLDISNIIQTTIKDMVTITDNALKMVPQFDYDFTGCQLIDITDPSQNTDKVSYVKIACKLKDTYAPIVPNLKLAAKFMYDPSSIFYGQESFLGYLPTITKYSDAAQKVPIYYADNSGNPIFEFNELIAEYPILQSNYDGSNVTISFNCFADGYKDSSYNDFRISVPSNTNYTLGSFISAFNSAALNQMTDFANSHSNYNSIKVNMSQDYSSYLNINSQFSMVYLNNNYQVRVSGNKPENYLNKLFDISTINQDIPSNKEYNTPDGYIYISASFSKSETLYISPKKGFGNSNAKDFEVIFDSTDVYDNPLKLASYLQNTIISYQDPITLSNPLSGSLVTYNSNGKFTLYLAVSVSVTQSFYKMTLDSSSSIWAKLKFDNSYNLVDYSNNKYTVKSEEAIKNNQITIKKGKNDTFYINPSNKVDVFNSSGSTYAVQIKIPDTSNGIGTPYAINDIINAINLILSDNPISNGSIISLYTYSNGQNYIKFKFNLNVIFSTKDYNLVFYDPYSFVSCISNKSKNSSSSLQNATWDSTLGWLLGYRNEIAYVLSDYVGITPPSDGYDPSIYYLRGSQSNVCVLLGDTNVSTNLYNYFLIMLDDYVQNHLNDGLVTITNQETIINPGPYKYICDPVTKQQTAVPADYGSPGVTYTSQELYAFNREVQSQSAKLKSYSSGPFVQDIFGIIPVKTSGMPIGSVYVEFGGTLQNQQRLYFGPVNIHRMTIKLLNDRGNMVNLNNANWSFSFVCEQLYKSGVS
jgi:hypothetical protein